MGTISVFSMATCPGRHCDFNSHRRFHNRAYTDRRAAANQRTGLAIFRNSASAASQSLSAAARSGVPATVLSRAIEVAMTRSNASRHSRFEAGPLAKVKR